MGNCLSTESRTHFDEIPGIAYTVPSGQDYGAALDDPNAETALGDQNSSVRVVDPLVQCISQEIAEFREQLRRGQEQIQAMSNSVSSFDTTKSCPGLVELKETQTIRLPKPMGVTIATQTESVAMKSTVQTYAACQAHTDSIDSFNDISDFVEADELGDDDTRLLRGSEALSVIEESENESDSPGALQRKMSADKGNRPKLVRMRNTVDDPPPILEEDVKSDVDYLSATSSLSGSKNPSLYNSLERPLHVSQLQSAADGNGDDYSDTYSTVSGGNTTYGSPISSPSSPTYLTPSQGSSSQETLTYHDGDKTPIIYEELLEEDSRCESILTRGSNSRSGSIPTKLKSSWQMLPIDNRQTGTSVGVIPDEDQEHMRQYAYDVTRRSCNSDAAILSRKEWRTLRSDLDQVDMETFKKGYGQEDDTEEGGLCKSSAKADLDEVAESYCEQFPFLAETIFQYLETTAQEKVESVDDLPGLKQRFEELATTFRADHDKLEGRSAIVKNEHDTARHKVSDIISSLKQTVQTIRSERVSVEIREACNSIENWVAEIELQTKSLDRSAQRSGRLDVVRRVFKIIEVMVLYVRILNTVCRNLEEERQLTRKILEERGIEFPKKATTINTHHNNNNHEVGQSFDVNDKPFEIPGERSGTHILQRLLGPKHSPDRLDASFELTLRQPKLQRRYFPRFVYDAYETVLREFHWPWDTQQTWGGVRKTFALLLMLFGIFLICRISFIPACESIESIVSYSYDFPPRI